MAEPSVGVQSDPKFSMVLKFLLIDTINMGIGDALEITDIEVSNISEHKSRDGIGSLCRHVIKVYVAHVLQPEGRPKLSGGKTHRDIVQLNSFSMPDKKAISRQLSEH